VTRRSRRDAGERSAVLSRPRVAVREREGGRERKGGRELDKLWRLHRRSDTDETRNHLVEAYQSLLNEVVRRFMARLPRSVERGDLDTAANFGLISAIEGFDRERGVPFESYCELRVKGAMLDELRNQDWLPRPWRARLELHKRVCERLRSEKGCEPADELVAVAMEMPLDEYQQVFGAALPGAPTGSMPSEESGEDGVPGLDIVPDPNADSAAKRLTQDEILKLVAQRLSVQEYRVVYLKYWEELSMREIGQLLHLSESRVCKIHAKLLERLKDRFRVHVDE
jgi:RNA polymerase sigma factor for flagellar operon FliA